MQREKAAVSCWTCGQQCCEPVDRGVAAQTVALWQCVVAAIETDMAKQVKEMKG